MSSDNQAQSAALRVRGRHRAWLALAWLLCAPAAHSAPASLQSTAEVDIIRPLKVTPTRELDFGSLLIVNLNVLGSARLTLSPSGRASASGGLLTVWAAAGRHPGEAKVSGEPQLAYVVSAPSRITLPWGNNTLFVQDFRFASSTRGGSGPSGYVAQVNRSGNDVLAIGGTLVFPPRVVGTLAALLSRSLAVTVPVTVQYQ